MQPSRNHADFGPVVAVAPSRVDESKQHSDQPREPVETHMVLVKKNPLRSSASGKVKQISERKREANHKNAQLSTGPRTERGKNFSRSNAWKHGMLARTIILGKVPFPGFQEQDQQNLKMVWRELFSDLCPVGMTEEILVERIACIYFQLSLRYRFQRAVTRIAIENGMKTLSVPRQETATDSRKREELRKELRDLLKRCKRALASDELLPDALMEEILARIPNPWSEQIQLRFDWVNHAIRKANYPWEDPDFNELRDEIEEQKDDFLHALMSGMRTMGVQVNQELDAARVEQHLVPEDGVLGRILRYESMLGRELDRSLDRLERLQRSRRAHGFRTSEALEDAVPGEGKVLD